MNNGRRDILGAAARYHGAAATRIVATAVFGTRHTPDTNASDAYSQRSAVGVFTVGAAAVPSSVWNGPPRAARTGEPVLRRAKVS